MLTWQQGDAIADISDEFRKKHTLFEFPFRLLPILSAESCETIWYDLPHKVDSLCLTDESSDISTILVNQQLRDNKGRLRFTLAHEIGHVVTMRMGLDYDEEACDEFAACLLMPEGRFRRVYWYSSIPCHEYFHVSKQAAAGRLGRLQAYRWHSIDLEKEQQRQKCAEATIFYQPAWYQVGNHCLPEPWVGI